MRIRRTGERFHARKSIPKKNQTDGGPKYELFEGVRSTIHPGGLSPLHAIERGDSYIQLPAGVYECRFGWWTNSRGRRERVIRFLRRISGPGELTEEQADSLRKGRFCMRAASKPWEVGGCFAVGLFPDELGVVASREAMRLLFDALGGWQEGGRCRVKIEDATPRRAA